MNNSRFLADNLRFSVNKSVWHRNTNGLKELCGCKTQRKKNGFKQGDLNTPNFHRCASGKKKRNTIAKLVISGVELFDQNTIKEKIRSHYLNIFTERNNISFTLDNMHQRRDQN